MKNLDENSETLEEFVVRANRGELDFGEELFLEALLSDGQACRGRGGWEESRQAGRVTDPSSIGDRQFEFDDLKPEPKQDVATVGSYLHAWLKEHATVNCKPPTFSEY